MQRGKARQLRAKIEQASVALPDEDALEAVELFPAWKADADYVTGDRRQYNQRIYKCRQPHKSQSIYPPDIVPALWEEIAKPGSGETPDDPIAYNNNMALDKGKYYEQGGIVYGCFRSTGITVYNDLADLVEIYVKIWEGKK